jgi:hypothetical protein
MARVHADLQVIFGMLKCRKDAKSVCGGILGKEVKREGGREYA